MRAAQFERLLEAALEDGCVTDAVVAENIAQAHQLWHIRESIPLAQAEEGLNIKHDISIAGVAHPRSSAARPTRCCARQIPGVRLVNFGHLGDGNLHYNVQAPEGGDAAAFLRDWEEQRQHAGVRPGRSASTARSRPSTASAASRWTSWSSTSRRWRWR